MPGARRSARKGARTRSAQSGTYRALIADASGTCAGSYYFSVTEDQLRELLESVRSGATGVDHALERVKHLPFEDLGFAKVDHHRALRHGIPEVVFGLGKSPDQVSAIVRALAANARNVLVTRADKATAERLIGEHPEAEYFPASGAVRLWRD